MSIAICIAPYVFKRKLEIFNYYFDGSLKRNTE